MASETIIRRADETDLPVIRRLAHDIWPEVYEPIIGAEQVQYMLDLFYDEAALLQQFSQGQVFLLGSRNAEAIAYASYLPDVGSGVYKVAKLYVSPSLQGKGIGRKMLDAIALEVLRKGAVALRLNVNRYNPAFSFYKKYGFVVVAEEDIPIGEGFFMNDFIMEKRLAPAG